MSKTTPMMKQYLTIKDEYQEAILFFHLGDFYETFFEDAKLCAKKLNIALTSRNDAPMAGVPIKKAQNYINKLLKIGHKVAICEQVEDPKQAKGLVKREVVKVITPGTVIDEEVLEKGINNYLASIFMKKESLGLALVDLSTGEFKTTEINGEKEVRGELTKLQPAEIILSFDQKEAIKKSLESVDKRVALTPVEDSYFQTKYLRNHFDLGSIKGLGLGKLAAKSAGALVKYLEDTQKTTLTHLERPSSYSILDYMQIDPFTQRNLELVRELRGGGGKTLLSVLDNTKTGMGKRLLRNWLLNPLVDKERIEERLEVVEIFFAHSMVRKELRKDLDKIYDIERLAGKLGSKSANPRDLISLKNSLQNLPKLINTLSELKREGKIKGIISSIEKLSLDHLTDLLERAMVNEPPTTIKEGEIIKEGYSQDLDGLKAEEEKYKDNILRLENSEKKRTGIESLKVGFNNVFGYYLEVTKTNMDKVPPNYHRKQTLSNCERYIIPKLKKYEDKILAAQEKSQKLEYEIFCQVRDKVAGRIVDIQKLAEKIALLDVFATLAKVARENDYCRPQFVEKQEFDIHKGRHPVVEKQVEFVPNNLQMDSGTKLVILTGPNMSGKSVYLRQVAQITLMAQMGSFVPANSATLPIMDKIFTRVGATDMLAEGYSTFMMEMLETATILNNATPRSLIILDEMGRGTSTFDGVSIAWAVAKYLTTKVGAKTLFATHYHELTKLEDNIEGVKNLNVQVKEYGDQVIFLHKVTEGKAEGSYGVHVAKLAGLPDQVIEESEEILAQILKSDPLQAMESGKPETTTTPQPFQQMALFNHRDHPIIKKIEEIDIDLLTPLEALKLLAEFKEKL